MKCTQCGGCGQVGIEFDCWRCGGSGVEPANPPDDHISPLGCLGIILVFGLVFYLIFGLMPQLVS